MSALIAEHPVHQLRVLMTETSTGRRSSGHGTTAGRTLPARVRFWGEDQPGGQHVYQFENIADRLLAISSTFPFREGHILSVELQVGEELWQERMKVVSSIPLEGGWRVHLEWTTDLPDKKSQLDPDLPDPTPAFRTALREKAWFEHARTDLRRVSNDARRARWSCGLLGSSTRRRIARAVFAVPGDDEAPADGERRRLRRRRTQTVTHLIVQANHELRVIEGRIVDISHEGLRVVLSSRSQEMASHPPVSTGDELHEGTPLAVGLGAEPDILWLPAEVVRVESPEGPNPSLGLRFMTPRSLRAING